MAIMTQSQIWNPVTGVFGTGQMQIFGSGGSGAWTVPVGIDRVRVRLWGGGGGYIGSGGGFAIKVIYGLAGVVSIPVTVGAGGTTNGYGGTSSFGAYASATGGGSGTLGRGTGLGGDSNYSGGFSGGTSGGGVANLFGNGGGYQATSNLQPLAGASGFGSTATTLQGGGFIGNGGGSMVTSGSLIPPTSGFEGGFSIDLIGTGGGGSGNGPGINGGGAGSGSKDAPGGYPGGGGGSNAYGAPGMVIVEW
jgi:hypothetical protein